MRLSTGFALIRRRGDMKHEGFDDKIYQEQCAHMQLTRLFFHLLFSSKKKPLLLFCKVFILVFFLCRGGGSHMIINSGRPKEGREPQRPSVLSHSCFVLSLLDSSSVLLHRRSTVCYRGSADITMVPPSPLEKTDAIGLKT